ncbi:glycine hydroxymethyltransferase [Amanita muscaria]
MSINNAHDDTPDYNRALYIHLSEADPLVQNIIDKETWRQFSNLELINSENLTSRATMEASGSILTNKYSDGLPAARWHGGTEYLDQLELLCRKRALQVFDLDPEQWGVNVQLYSGSTANFAALTALIQPHDRLMGLSLPEGGQLAHGYYTPKMKKVNSSSIYFESLPYSTLPGSNTVDYDSLASQANLFKPQLIICGSSSYPRDWDFERLRQIADKQSAFLMADITHTGGLVAGREQNSPFEHCDVVTTATHTTFRGPRAGLIFFRKDKNGAQDLEKRVNQAVYPACQGGPHNNRIAAIAVALKQAMDPSWRAYAKQVIANAKALASYLLEHGYKLQTGGTDNHFVLWDLRPLGLTGSKVEKLCELMGIIINRNAIAGDSSALVPNGICLGTSALTSRDMKEEDMRIVGGFLHRAVQLAVVLQKEADSKMLKNFLRVATTPMEGNAGYVQVKQLRDDVRQFAMKWPLPGVDIASLKKPEGFIDHV